MSLPPELKEPIDDIKTPSNRVLVSCLILAIMALSSVIIWQTKGNNKSCEAKAIYWEDKFTKKSLECDSLIIDKIKTVSDENARLRQRDAWQDSIKYKILNKVQ